MRKQLKKIALAAVFALTVSLFAPAAQPAEAATKKQFTYAEQKTGDEVTVLEMEPGEQVDLKFIGVPDYQNYTRKWTTSDPKTAVVDSAGVITALEGNGEKNMATIKLKIGDGSVYSSVGVTVYVSDKWKERLTIGTAAKDEIKSYIMEMGQSVVLKETGLLDNIADRYTCEWSSTDTSVAKISSSGKVTPVAPGLTVIQLTVTKVATGEKSQAMPIALLVTEKGGAIAPTEKVTPAPTEKVTPAPTQTVTPAPTAPVETVTPAPVETVTPTPQEKPASYSVKLESAESLLLTFAEKVSYGINDVKLMQQIPVGSSVQEVYQNIADVTLDSTGRQLRIKPTSKFVDGEKYVVRVGSGDPGTLVNVTIGLPNRIEVTYECMGKEKIAYAQDANASVEVPVTLKYRVYSGTVDVTDTYSNGYMLYEFKDNKQPENVQLSDNVLNFYEAGVSAVIQAKYIYYDENGNSKEITKPLTIRSTKLPDYRIVGVVKHTLIDTTDTTNTKINWNNTTNKVISKSDNYKLVAMIADSYGNYFVTDERGVDEANKIYSITDYNQLFFKYGYGVEFEAADKTQIIVNDDGTIYPFQVMNTAGAVLKITMNGTETNQKIGPCPIIVLDESKLTSVTAEESRVTLATAALPGYESRFCEKEVEIFLKDQYGNEWKGESNLELTSAIAEINSALNAALPPARLEGNKLCIDAENIKAVTNKTNVSFLITETTTNKKLTVNVTLQNPTMTNGVISTNNWSLGLKNNRIVLGEVVKDSVTQHAVVEAYQLSGSIKVGLYGNVQILEKLNHQFTTSNCQPGEVYVVVKGPDGKVVKMADNESSLGVYFDSADSSVKVNVSAPVAGGSTMLQSMAAGQYTVTATRIISVGNAVQKATMTSYFTVEDKTKNVEFRSLKSDTTSLTVSGNGDQAGIKAIVENVCTFTLGGKEWTSWNANMISNVEYALSGKSVVIQKVEFAVPVDETQEYGMTYPKSCVVNKVVETGVN